MYVCFCVSKSECFGARIFIGYSLCVSSIRNDPLEFGNEEESRSILNNKLEHFQFDTNRKYANPNVMLILSAK